MMMLMMMFLISDDGYCFQAVYGWGAIRDVGNIPNLMQSWLELVPM